MKPGRKAYAELTAYAAGAVLPPCPTDVIATLKHFTSRKSSLVARVIRSRALEPHTADQQEVVRSLLDWTGWNALARKDRFMAAKPDDWARFSEPQITRGWSHFLDERHSLARCQAAFAASWSKGVCPQIVMVERIEAESERMDLLIAAEDDAERRVGLCIEAKFGHHITDGQLDTYRQRLLDPRQERDDRMPISADLLAHLVIAPRRLPRAMTQVDGTEGWLLTSWQTWLIAHENALPPACDDEAFCRFRRTTLKRAHAEYI